MKVIPIKNILDSVSPTFCAAKWNYSTIWLNDGSTASCFHCTKHKADLAELQNNPSVLHNTAFKKEMRKLMVEGKRPSECDYCWKIEDSNKDAMSDRVLLSSRYTEEEILECKESGYENDHSPRILEIAFDNLCNFACMYCDPVHSSSWQADIKKFGIYQNLKTEHQATYMHDGAGNIPFSYKNVNNPYIEAFWKWLDGDLKKTLKELKVTGGEPLMSPQFDRLISTFKQPEFSDIRISFNTNLGNKRELIDKFIDLSKTNKKISFYTSCETSGKAAEFVRDGMIWEEWKNNLIYLLENIDTDRNQSPFGIVITTTINVFTIFGLVDFLEEIKQIKNRPNNRVGLTLSFNLLTSPSFQSVDVLPNNLVKAQSAKIKQWVDENPDFFGERELKSIQRCISMFDRMDENKNHNLWKKRQDLKSFVDQFCARRNKTFSDSFDKYPELVEWVNSLF